MKKYVVLEKLVGETPLQCAEQWRATQPNLQGVPLAYAGRLDPMASGKLLVLIGEECKQQEQYHALDKEYQVEILLGVSSDSGDVLGVLKEDTVRPQHISRADMLRALSDLTGEITLPYPIYSSKPVHGKPLHTWAAEGRLDEISIPSYTATIYKNTLQSVVQRARQELYDHATKKIELLPPVTDPRKSLGNDFRRPLVRESWAQFLAAGRTDDLFYIVTITCIASSGAYMRTLADEVAKKVGTTGLAWSIHRSHVGHYRRLPFGISWWTAP